MHIGIYIYLQGKKYRNEDWVTGLNIIFKELMNPTAFLIILNVIYICKF